MRSEPGKARRARPVSEEWLERAALHYLGRYAATRARLVEVLIRKVRRRHEDDAPPSAEEAGWVEAVADRCVELGYVDDAAYARARAATLLRKGKPGRAIAADLRHRGIGEEGVVEALEKIDTDENAGLDRRAAAALARRRRFGAFGTGKDQSDDRRRKELGAMMRAGFSYSLAVEILDMEEEALRELL